MCFTLTNSYIINKMSVPFILWPTSNTSLNSAEKKKPLCNPYTIQFKKIIVAVETDRDISTMQK